jgi:hypothetical protein
VVWTSPISGVDVAQLGGADLDDVAVVEHVLADALVVQHRPVARPQVAQAKGAVPRLDDAVMAARPGVVQHQGVVSKAADGDRVRLELEPLQALR